MTAAESEARGVVVPASNPLQEAWRPPPSGLGIQHAVASSSSRGSRVLRLDLVGVTVCDFGGLSGRMHH